jgi:hypothetical protein
MIARLPEMHRQLRELSAQVAALTHAAAQPSEGASLAGLPPTTEPQDDPIGD